MHPRLLRFYESELKFMREMGAEFAAEFEKIGAGRLGMERLACADPYVERLLEGFSFLAARIQLKLDAQFPRFSQHLLEMVYPNYLAPMPSMAVVQFVPDAAGGTPPDGLAVPRGTVLRSRIVKGEQTACEYRTAHELRLLPIAVTEAEYLPSAGALGALGIPDLPGAQAGLRLRIATTGGVKLATIPLDRLALHLRGGENLPGRLYEQLIVNRIAVVVRPVGRPAPWHEVVAGTHVRPLGLDDAEALLPTSRWGFQGYRLLAEYFACPERFLFVELGGLARAVRRCETDEALEIVVVVNRRESMLERVVDASNVALFCTPAVNLFTRDRCRVQVDQGGVEYHVVPDRTRPRDYEVYSVNHATGYDGNGEKMREFRPFYSIHDRYEIGDGAAYFSLRREPRRLGLRDRRTGPRSHYVGSEVFLSLTDPWGGPYEEDVRQIELSMLCTNRDLPFHMEIGQGPTDFTLESGLSVDCVRCLVGPTRPRASAAEGELAWRLISQLSLNYLSLLDAADGQGASAIRELLRLYGDPQDTRVQRQIDGLRSVTGRQIVDQVPQIPGEAPMTFARGVEVTVVGDDSAFQGGGIVLLGTVLDEFFARYVTINSFTKVVLRTVERGEIMRWPARIGRRHAI
jgi:type VI secretion system protein ImpG